MHGIDNIKCSLRDASCGHFQTCCKIKYISCDIVSFANFLFVKIKLLMIT